MDLGLPPLHHPNCSHSIITTGHASFSIRPSSIAPHPVRCNADGSAHRRTDSGTSTQSKGKVRRFSLGLGVLDAIKDLHEQTIRDLSPMNAEKLRILRSFEMVHEDLTVMPIKIEQFGDLVSLLTDTFAESMWGIFTYKPLLSWVLIEYLKERQACIPHATILVALKHNPEGREDDECELVGAVEISFDAKGQPKGLMSPTPPKDAPFLSNMAVMKKFRRRGIGSQLLKASEKLAIQMGCSEMYLHCRLVDKAPLQMYSKAGYEIVATDSILILLAFQRRQQLMRKCLFSSVIAEAMEH